MQQFLKHFPCGGDHLLSTHAMRQVRALWAQRWKGLFTPLHAIGYALDPEYIDHKDIMGEREIAEAVDKILQRLAPDKVAECLEELHRYVQC